MPLAQPSRWFLSAALGHLSAAALLLVLGPWDHALSGSWPGLLWLIVLGFVGFTTIGFSYHLYPTFSRRRPSGVWLERATFPLAEAAVILGTWVAGWPQVGALPPWVFSFAAVLYTSAALLVLYLFARMAGSTQIAAGPSPRKGDSVTLPLFLASFAAAPVAGGLFALSGIEAGPGFGWWLAAVHLFLLGHVVLLVVAVTLRLLPRYFGADPSSVLVPTLAILGLVGSVSVPVGFLISNPSRPTAVQALALPEAALAVVLLATIAELGWRARTPRRQLGMYGAAAAFFVVGGGLGLWMVAQADYGWVETHAFVNIFGFIGLMILLMWFGMIAPFQRVSHAWTRRALWGLSTAWVVVVLSLALTEAPASGIPGMWAMVAGGLLLVIAVLWAVGTLPVLYPSLNPLPGVRPDRLRDRRQRRDRP